MRHRSNDVYNLVTKRAVAYEGATVKWVDGNVGSKVTITDESAHGASHPADTHLQLGPFHPIVIARYARPRV
jgi:Fe-S cluster assembly scaffold protein SufB